MAPGTNVAAAMPKVETQYFPLKGGIDQVSPALTLLPGVCRDALNFECNLNGGYQRIAGFERFDGHPSPSAASYYAVILQNETLGITVAVGSMITGHTSGATATVAYIDTTTSANYPNSEWIALVNVTGAFILNELLYVGSTSVGIFSLGLPQLAGAITPALDAQYQKAAADYFRSNIGQVPGSGNILGVWVYNDIVYAFRNNTGGTAALMYASSSTGWVQVGMPLKSATVTAGGTGYTTAPTVLINGVSGLATATVSGGAVTGITITTPGAYTSVPAITFSGGGGSGAAATAVLLTLLPGGRYEFVNGNFGGTTQMLKMFGVDGTNKGFMFDGTNFTQITTGMPTDTPNHVEFHKNFLFYAFGASLQFSSIGDPTTWNVVLGAGELALGDTITSLKSYIGNNSYIGTEAVNALMIHTSSKTFVLYGSDQTSFSLAKHSDTAGGIAGSVQVIDQPYYFSDLGIVNLSVTQAYGNFIMTTISEALQPFINQERTRISSSCIVRQKSQYRLFFDDGYALYVTFLNGKVLGLMIEQLGIPIVCCVSSKLLDNTEVIYAGSNTGYVYQMESGPNFDGQQIMAYLNLAFAHFKSPRVLKRFRKAVLEVKGTGYFEYYASYDLGWANTDIAPTPPFFETGALSASRWDNFTWDQFYWDGVNNAPTDLPLDGTGENIGLKILSISDHFEPFTIASATMHFTLRRQLR